MSFFTSNVYASFHQHLPPNMQGLQSDSKVSATASRSSGSSVGKKLSPQKQVQTGASNNNTSNASFARRMLDNSSFASTSSTTLTISEFDPLSPLNLTRATDPWFGNSLLANSPSNGMDVSAGASLKVYDQIDDEDWGEFVNFGTQSKEQDRDNDCEFDQEASKSRRASNKAAKFEREYEGWQRIPRANSDGSDDNDDGDTGKRCLDDHKDMYKALPYQSQGQPHHYNQQGSQSLGPYQQRRPSDTLESFASAVLSRFSSFRSTAMNDKSASPSSSSSWPTRLFSGEGETQAAPARGYDSYDVAFEKGPIGLELETDWYGRQAVVKGFRKVLDNQDGPALQCGIIRVGDVLTAVDGDSCLEMSFQETLAKLREVSGRKRVLHFKSLEAAGDLSVYSNDMDIIQAKKFIHQHKEKFYRQPPPSLNKEGKPQLILGCVERLRGETVTAFNFHHEDTGEFILACSCVNECTGVFIFHTLQDSHLRAFKDLPQSEDSAVYLGQMVPNFLGTDFTVLDHQQKRRNELGLLVYSSNVLGRIPNFLKCVFPRQPPVPGDGDEESVETEELSIPRQRPRAATTGSGMGSNSASFNLHNTMMDRNGSISERYKNLKQQRRLSLVERLRHFSLDDLETSLEYASGNIEALWHDSDDHESRSRAMRMKPSRSVSTQNFSTPYGAVEQNDFQCDLLTFETKKPAWNDELGAWTLNFHGRVKLASKKNFLMVPEQGNEQMEAEFSEEAVYLRFGKVSKSRFSLDYQAPISPLMALAIICSSFAHKIAVTDFQFQARLINTVQSDYDWETLLSNAVVLQILIRWMLAMVVLHRGYYSLGGASNARNNQSRYSSTGIGCLANCYIASSSCRYCYCRVSRWCFFAFWTSGCVFERSQHALSETWFVVYPAIAEALLLYFSLLNLLAKLTRRRISDALFGPTLIFFCAIHRFRDAVASSGLVEFDGRVATLITFAEFDESTSLDFFNSSVAVHTNGGVKSIFFAKVLVSSASQPVYCLWRRAAYATGYVAAIGDHTHLKVGDAVGVKWLANSCLGCEDCRKGHESTCQDAQLHGFSVDGSFQQWAVSYADHLTPIPKDLDMGVTAPILCAGLTTYKALKEIGGSPGEFVAIPGAGGGLGHLACQYAKAMGYRVIAIDSGEDKRKLVASYGIKDFIDFKDVDVEAQVMAATEGRGAHAVVVVASGGNAYKQALSFLRPHGAVVLVGIPKDAEIFF